MHQYCNRSYQCRNRPYWYTVTAHIGTVTTQIDTQTIECLYAKSTCISLCNHWHISTVLQFFLPKKPEPIHYLRAMRSSNSFSLINFFSKGSFFFSQSLKHLSADHLRCENRCFYMVTSVGFVSYILGPPRWPSGKASASRAEDPRFESRLRRDFFGVESYQWLKNWHSSGYPARRLAL